MTGFPRHPASPAPTQERARAAASQAQKGRGRGTMKGLFKPTNPQKYLGDPGRIAFRSSWELRLMSMLDRTPAILQWASEEFSIPYKSPLDGRVHRYYPDFLVVYRNAQGGITREIVEVKPASEDPTQPIRGKMTPQRAQALAVNQAKWDAARAFAEAQGMTFRVATEKTMFYQGKKR